MTRFLHRAALAAMLTPIALAASGCAVAAWMAAQFAPPEKVEAKYSPPKGKTMLVFVDDLLNPVDYEPVKIELADRIGQLLVANKIAAKTVPYSRLAGLMAAEPNFNLLPVSTVGEKLGADIVLYVQIDEFSLRDEAAQQLWRGSLSATVRMVDVKAGRLWPKDRPSGYMMPSVDTPTTAESSETQAQEITATLAADMAQQIAQLFYGHEKPREGGWEEQHASKKKP